MFKNSDEHKSKQNFWHPMRYWGTDDSLDSINNCIVLALFCISLSELEHKRWCVTKSKSGYSKAKLYSLSCWTDPSKFGRIVSEKLSSI